VCVCYVICILCVQHPSVSRRLVTFTALPKMASDTAWMAASERADEGNRLRPIEEDETLPDRESFHWHHDNLFCPANGGA
jgi:hypothetical protein